MTIRVLVVDDDADMRRLVRSALAGSADVKVVREATSGDQAVEAFRDARPDVIVLDQAVPGMSGLDVAYKILGESPLQNIVLFSTYLNKGVRQRAEALGICEIVSKDRHDDLLAAVLRCVA